MLTNISFCHWTLVRFGGSALTDDIDVPKSGVGNEIPVTYVPARNLIFLSLTLGLAKREMLATYLSVSTHWTIPAIRIAVPSLLRGLKRLADLATKAGDQGSGFTIKTPLQYMTKADISKEARRLDIDPALSWSCYDPAEGNLHCGFCDSCPCVKKALRRRGLQTPLATR